MLLFGLDIEGVLAKNGIFLHKNPIMKKIHENPAIYAFYYFLCIFCVYYVLCIARTFN